MILYVDTTNFDSLHLALVDPKNTKPVQQTSHELAFNENYKTAAFLQTFMQSAKVRPQDLTKIVTCSGPGSFTGIRVGAALSEAMSFALNIPLVFILKKKVPEDLQKLTALTMKAKPKIEYGRKPNITKPKKRK